MNNLAVRAASGLVFAIIMIGGILWTHLSFMAVMLLILAGSVREYFIITSSKREHGTRFSGNGLIAFLFVFTFLFSYMLLSPPVRALPSGSNLLSLLFQAVMMQRDADISYTALFPMLLFALFIIELFTEHENPFVNLGWNVLGAVWILLPLMLTTKLYFEQGGIFLIAVFCIIWFYDSACYVAGSLFGKHPMFARISPKKTWEGLAGGVLLTLTAAYFLPLLPWLQMLHRAEWMVLAAVIIFAATFGDLVESLLKRSLNIKDSGNIMPGHGGFLDRFDAYFLSVPFVVFIMWVFNQVRGLQLLMDFVG